MQQFAAADVPQPEGLPPPGRRRGQPPVGRTARNSTAPSCGGSRRSSLPAAVSHTATTPSSPPVRQTVPAALRATVRTWPLHWNDSPAGRPAFTSHRRKLSPLRARATNLPRGPQANPKITAGSGRRRSISFPVAASQTRTNWSCPAVATVLPPGPKAAARSSCRGGSGRSPCGPRPPAAVGRRTGPCAALPPRPPAGVRRGPPAVPAAPGGSGSLPRRPRPPPAAGAATARPAAYHRRVPRPAGQAHRRGRRGSRSRRERGGRFVRPSPAASKAADGASPRRVSRAPGRGPAGRAACPPSSPAAAPPRPGYAPPGNTTPPAGGSPPATAPPPRR